MPSRYDIGFLGGGQLARMSIMAAQRMGLRCISLDPSQESPASQIAASIVAPLDDPQAVGQILSACNAVTLENEFIPAAGIPDDPKLMPGVGALAIIQDKLKQRQALMNARVPSPKAIALEDASSTIEMLGFPMVLKTRFGGYDGKGTRYAMNGADLEALRPEWSRGGWLAEAYVPFQRELAAMVFVRGGEKGAFPTMETVQTNHVCDLVYPCDADATEIAIAAVEAVGGQGLFGVELFELEDGSFQVNELAPRPHNTGHYTLDWGGISQFEQHVRLVAGLPLGEPHGAPTCMANLLGQPGSGDFRLGVAAALEDPSVRVHWYGKAEAKPGRKMGHLNVVGVADMVERAIAARDRFYSAWAL